MTFSTGLSSLRAHQTAMSVAGHNIANASTEGYRRQEVIFLENPTYETQGLSIGTGVRVDEIRSASNSALEAALMESDSDGAMLSAQMEVARQIDALFVPGTGTLQERTEELFLSLERLSARPTDATLRSTVVHAAGDVANEINRISEALTAIAIQTESQIRTTIEQMKDLVGRIAQLNDQIKTAENMNQEPTALRSQRDILVRELAGFVDVEHRVTSDGDAYWIAGGLFTVQGGLDLMELRQDDDGRLTIWREGCDEPHELSGGRLAGLLAENNGNSGILGFRDRLDQFVSSLVTHLDRAHATGVGINGAFSNLTSGRPIEDTTAALHNESTLVPLSKGTLFVSVNDKTTGSTALEEVSFDPRAHSLEDLATTISGIDRLDAHVDSLGRISIVAETGFSFDFTGNLQTHPDATLSGTSTPEVVGRYTGNTNEEYSITFVGSGTVGVTSGLQAEVRNRTGHTVRVIEIGTDFEPGSRVVIDHGIEVSLTSGTVVDGESFSITAPAQPDETGLLAALGLNTMFHGNTASTIVVNPDLVENSSRLATTTNGEPSDTRNLDRMLAVRETSVLRDGTVTIDQYLADLASEAGRSLESLGQDFDAFEEHNAYLQSEIAAVSGVDVNQELTRMLQYQRAYQAAARYIAVVDESMQQLFALVR